MIDQTKIQWELRCSKKTFRSMKDNEEFLSILTLARIVNALRFCQISLTQIRGQGTPSAQRQRINSFLFASSVLYEGCVTVKTLGKHFKSLSVYRDGLGTLFKSNEMKTLIKILKLMRNKSVFHFDKQVAIEALNNFHMTSNVFATGYGDKVGDVYYGMADAITIHFFFEDIQSKFGSSFTYQKLVKQTSSIMGQFAESSEQLIAEVLKDLGCSIHFIGKT